MPGPDEIVVNPKTTNEKFKDLLRRALTSDPAALQAVLRCITHGWGSGSFKLNGREAQKLFKIVSGQEEGVERNTNLALCHQKGIGVKVNIPTALCLFELAADKGYTLAQSSLGCYYFRYIENQKYKEKALGLLGLAAAKGDISANYLLGMFLFRIPPNNALEAEPYLRRVENEGFEDVNEAMELINRLTNEWNQVVEKDLDLDPALDLNSFLEWVKRKETQEIKNPLDFLRSTESVLWTIPKLVQVSANPASPAARQQHDSQQEIQRV